MTVSNRLEAEIQEQLRNWRTNPIRRNWAVMRRDHSWVVADTSIMRGDHKTAAKAVHEMVQEVGHWADFYNAACLMARCISLVVDDRRVSETERRSLARDYVNEGRSFLKRAIAAANGDLKVARVMSDPELEPLRSNDGFMVPPEGLLSPRQSREVSDLQRETAVQTDRRSKGSFLESLIRALGPWSV